MSSSSKPCMKCAVDLSDGDTVKCMGCNADLHYSCAGVKKSVYTSKSLDNKAKFRCGSCKKGDTPPVPKSDIPFDFSLFRGLIDDLKAEIRGIREDFREDIRESLKQIREELFTELKSLKEEVSDLKKKCEVKEAEVVSLQSNVNKLEQSTRNKNLIIDNIEQLEGEDVEDIVIKLGGLLHINLKREDIETAHRLPSRKNKHAPKILVQFNSRKLRDEIVSARRQAANITSNTLIGGKIHTRIYISEHLTRFYNELLWQCKVRAKEKNYKFVWYKSSKILVQKDENSKEVIKVFSFADISKL